MPTRPNACGHRRSRSNASLRGQRELLQVTETILTKLDARDVLDAITDRIGGLIACDNIAIEILDPRRRRQPQAVDRAGRRRRQASRSRGRTGSGSGIAAWVVAHNEPVHISDRRTIPRVWADTADPRAHDGSIIATPSAAGRGRRRHDPRTAWRGQRLLRDSSSWSSCSAAQVSIALQNAEVFRGGRGPRPD